MTEVAGVEQCACCGDPAEPEKHNLEGPLCLDCAAAGCKTGVTTCAGRTTIITDGGGRERLVATWTDKPYTGVKKRHRTVEHRVKAVWYPGVGADIIHEVRSEDAGVDDWQLAEKWEFRDQGVDKLTTSHGGLL